MTRWISKTNFGRPTVVESAFGVISGLDEAFKVYVEHKSKEVEARTKTLQKEQRNIKKR